MSSSVVVISIFRWLAEKKAYAVSNDNRVDQTAPGSVNSKLPVSKSIPKRKTSDDRETSSSNVENALDNTKYAIRNNKNGAGTRKSDSYNDGDRLSSTCCGEHNGLKYLFSSSVGADAAPVEPLRDLHVASSDWLPAIDSDTYAGVDVTPEQIATSYLLKEARVAVRVGTLTVHRLGRVTFESPWFHESDILYPIGFESTRIFWSYKHPGARTLYVFDIIASTDIPATRFSGAVDSRMSECRIGVEIDALSFPVFRVTALDDSNNPFVSIFIEDCWWWINSKINSSRRSEGVLNNRSGPSIERAESELKLSVVLPIYNVIEERKLGVKRIDSVFSLENRLRAFRFFGIGLDFTRHATELTRESVATMMPTVFFKHFNEYLTRGLHEMYSKKLVICSSVSEQSVNHLNQLFASEKMSKMQFASYRPSYRLPQKSTTAELLLFISSSRSDKISGVNKRLRLSECSKAVGFTKKRYMNTDKDIDPLSFATGALMDKNKKGTRGNSRSTTKTVGETNNALMSPTKVKEITESKPLSSLDIQLRLEKEYWEMHKNNTTSVEAHLVVCRSEIHGWGLYAQRDYLPNSMIVEYVGEEIRHTVADRRELEYERESGLSGSCYLFRLDKDLVIDATYIGGMGRFLNHCCEPSSYAFVISTTFPRNSEGSSSPEAKNSLSVESTMLSDTTSVKNHIIIMAARHIKVFDYYVIFIIMLFVVSYYI